MKLRDRKYIYFVENFLDELKYFHQVIEHPSDSFKIITEEKGVFIYYPKSDKILETATNKWMYGGLNYIKKELLFYK